MGTVFLKSTINSCKSLANDLGVTFRWSNDEWLGFYNLGIREAVKKNPGVNSVVDSVELSPGTKQSIPVRGLEFVRLVKNMGVGGAQPGRVIFPAEMVDFDGFNPDWHFDDPGSVVENFMFLRVGEKGKRDKKVFYVYPPQPESGQGYVEMVFSQVPEEVVVSDFETTVVRLPVDDEWEPGIVQYMLFMAFSKDASNTFYAERAKLHFQAFLQGVK